MLVVVASKSSSTGYRFHWPCSNVLAVRAGEAAARFVDNWVKLTAVGPFLQPLMLYDIYTVLDDEDKAYFREQREKRFGKKLEEARPELNC